MGLSYCGADGEWPFGWLVDARATDPVSTTGPGKGPVKVGGVGPVLTAAR